MTSSLISSDEFIVGRGSATYKATAEDIKNFIGGGAQVIVADSAPAVTGLEEGTLWWDSVEGDLFVLYNDSSDPNAPNLIWVDATNHSNADDRDVIISDNRPASPDFKGQLWVNTNECPPELNVWDGDCDGNGGEWVPIEGGGGGTLGIATPVLTSATTRSNIVVAGDTLTCSPGAAYGGNPPYAYVYAFLDSNDNILQTSGGNTYITNNNDIGKSIYATVTVTDAKSNEAVGRSNSLGPIKVAGIINQPTVLGPEDGAGSGDERYLQSDTITKVENDNKKLTVDSGKDLDGMTGSVFMTDGTPEAGGSFKPASYTLLTSKITDVDNDADVLFGDFSGALTSRYYNDGSQGSWSKAWPATGAFDGKIATKAFGSNGYSQFAPVTPVPIDTSISFNADVYVNLASYGWYVELRLDGITQRIALTGPEYGYITFDAFAGKSISTTTPLEIQTFTTATGTTRDNEFVQALKIDDKLLLDNGTDVNTIDDQLLTASTVLTFAYPNPDLQYFQVGDVVQGTNTELTGHRIGPGYPVKIFWRRPDLSFANASLYALKINGTEVVEASAGGPYSATGTFKQATFDVKGGTDPNDPVTITDAAINSAHSAFNGSGITNPDGHIGDDGYIIWEPQELFEIDTIEVAIVDGLGVDNSTFTYQYIFEFSDGSFFQNVIPSSNGQWSLLEPDDNYEVKAPVSIIAPPDLVNNRMTVNGGNWKGDNNGTITGDPDGDTTVTVGPFTAEGTFLSATPVNNSYYYKVDLSTSTGRWIADNIGGINFSIAGPSIIDTPLLTADITLVSSQFSTTPISIDNFNNAKWTITNNTTNTPIVLDAGAVTSFKPISGTFEPNTNYTVVVQYEGDYLDPSAESASVSFTTGATRTMYDRVVQLQSRIDALESNEIVDDATDVTLLTAFSSLVTRVEALETGNN